MSKKKATMTLKDFHGGSIPSDLPLPSAPGAVIRPADWSGYDRPNTWGGSTGRTDYRVRPNSSPATRHFDDNTPFLTHTAHIGRNFDEDERKPLDGSAAPRRMISDDSAAPRRMISDDSFRFQPTRVEQRSEPVLGGRGLGRGWGNHVVGSYSGIVSESSRRGGNLQNFGNGSAQSLGASVANAWTTRKESAMAVNEVVQSAPPEVSMVSKMAHASALDKVLSGRWKTKQSVHHQVDVEVIDHSESEKALGSRFYDAYTDNRRDLVSVKEHADVTLPRHMERSFTVEDRVQGGRKEYLVHDRVGALLYTGIKDRKPLANDDRVLLPRTEVKLSGPEVQLPAQSDAQERLKVKLLPRTKPLESFSTLYTNEIQGYQQSSSYAHGHIENFGELHANARSGRPGVTGIESENHMVERPKLNLKPRSQPLEQSKGNSERERNALFGGARPRELVLKDRGIDHAAVSSHDLGQHSDRIKHSVFKSENAAEHAVPTRNQEKVENPTVDHRIGKKFERTDQRNEIDRVDMHRRNWRKNGRGDGGRQHQHQHVNQERPSSPETWCKHEQPKVASPDVVAMRYTKAASVLELAQAFSRSISEPKAAESYSVQKGHPGRNQVPFSRLVATNPRPQINGY